MKKFMIVVWLFVVIVVICCIVIVVGVDVEGFEKLVIILGIFWGVVVIFIVCFYIRVYLIL